MAPTDDPAEAAYLTRRAARVRGYSRAVRWMKVLLPVAALTLVVLIFLTGTTRESVVDVESAGTAAAIATGMRMENPRFAGVTDDGEPFVVTARTALPDGPGADRIDLEEPTGEIRLSDGMALTVAASRGLILRETQRLTLEGAVTLETSDGYRATTERLEIDLDAKTARLPAAVRAEGPRGGIEADRLDVLNPSGDKDAIVLRFQGGVRVTYLPAP